MERGRQFVLIKELLTATTLGTSPWLPGKTLNAKA
jgi:hypothetical protein